jgi:hypothetical protein
MAASAIRSTDMPAGPTSSNNVLAKAAPNCTDPMPSRSSGTPPRRWIWSAVLMLEFIGEDRASARLLTAREVRPSGPRTPDVGGNATTEQVGDAVVSALTASLWAERETQASRLARDNTAHLSVFCK